jgi:CHASE2 domain-containing sensor protein
VSPLRRSLLSAALILVAAGVLLLATGWNPDATPRVLILGLAAAVAFLAMEPRQRR